MQDWEWEVADHIRIDEFVAAYKSGEFSEDEKFTLMETILQSFEEQEKPLETDDGCMKVLWLIENNLELHIYSVWYWADLENDNVAEPWRVTPFMREILARHEELFD